MSDADGASERARAATSWGQRVALVLLGLLSSLALIEALLQLGAVYVRRTAHDRRAEWSGQARPILCLGDSNTYGTRVRRKDAYPAVLERLWNGQAGRVEVDVLNLGIPGMNSSKLRNNFRALLASLRPEIALVMVGANDRWTVPAPLDETQPTLAQLLWQRSRVFRLLYMIDRALGGIDPEPAPEIVVEPAPKSSPPENPGQSDGARGVVRLGERELDLTWTGKAKTRPSGWARALRANLTAMHQAAAENGTELVLLTYASELAAYGSANELIRGARADDLPVIDLSRALGSLCPGSCPDLFFPDGHPTRLGYQIVAVTVWRELARLHGRAAQPRDRASWEAVLDAEVRRRVDASERID